MFKKTTRIAPVQAIHTLLGKNTLWKGEIHAGTNSLRIEGTVEGTIHSDGEVTVAPTGIVNGTIHAKHLIVTGRVHGLFRILECLEIRSTGRVEGDLEFGSLVVDEGSTLQGTCTRRGLKKTSVALPGVPKGELSHAPAHIALPASPAMAEEAPLEPTAGAAPALPEPEVLPLSPETAEDTAEKAAEETAEAPPEQAPLSAIPSPLEVEAVVEAVAEAEAAEAELASEPTLVQEPMQETAPEVDSSDLAEAAPAAEAHNGLDHPLEMAGVSADASPSHKSRKRTNRK